MATIAKFEITGAKAQSMYNGELSFDKVCETIEKMIKTNNLVQNAKRTVLDRVHQISIPTRYCRKTRIYWVLLDGVTMARVIVKDMK